MAVGYGQLQVLSVLLIAGAGQNNKITIANLPQIHSVSIHWYIAYSFSELFQNHTFSCTLILCQCMHPGPFSRFLAFSLAGVRQNLRLYRFMAAARFDYPQPASDLDDTCPDAA